MENTIEFYNERNISDAIFEPSEEEWDYIEDYYETHNGCGFKMPEWI